jgi:hypothetical protein
LQLNNAHNTGIKPSKQGKTEINYPKKTLHLNIAKPAVTTLPFLNADKFI